MQKYEIIITPKDSQCCGKCTYKTKVLINDYSGIRETYCNLFRTGLDSPSGRIETYRCGSCKILTQNFTEMPELTEG